MDCEEAIIELANMILNNEVDNNILDLIDFINSLSYPLDVEITSSAIVVENERERIDRKIDIFVYENFFLENKNLHDILFKFIKRMYFSLQETE